MKQGARVVGIAVFASLFVACAAQVDQMQSRRVEEGESINLVCEPAIADHAVNHNHFLRARRINVSRSASDGEATSCLAQRQRAN